MKLFMKTENFDLGYSEGDTNNATLRENHCHIRFELISVIGGSIDIMVEGRAYRCSKGECAVIAPLTYHSVSVTNSGEYKRITALFDASALPEAVSGRLAKRSSESPIFRHSTFSSLSEELVQVIISGDEENYSPLANAIATKMLYTCADGTAAKHNETAQSNEGLLERVIRYIDANIEKKLTLDDIAQAHFISRSSLCHVFSERMQISPKQYIIQKKMAYASMLIANGASATHAARTVGYDNYSNFYRMYKKINTKEG